MVFTPPNYTLICSYLVLVIWLHLVALVTLNLIRLFEQWVLIHTQERMSLCLWFEETNIFPRNIFPKAMPPPKYIHAHKQSRD